MSQFAGRCLLRIVAFLRPACGACSWHGQYKFGRALSTCGYHRKRRRQECKVSAHVAALRFKYSKWTSLGQHYGCVAPVLRGMDVLLATCQAHACTMLLSSAYCDSKNVRSSVHSVEHAGQWSRQVEHLVMSSADENITERHARSMMDCHKQGRRDWSSPGVSTVERYPRTRAVLSGPGAGGRVPVAFCGYSGNGHGMVNTVVTSD